MKKITSIMIVLSLAVVCLAGCGTSEKQEAILKYYNTDMKTFTTENSEFVTSLDAIQNMDENTTVDEALAAVDDVALPALDKALAKIEAISSTDSEVQALHNKLIDAYKKYKEGLQDLSTALQSGEESTKSTELFTEGTNLINDWTTGLKKLCDDNDIEDTTSSN